MLKIKFNEELIYNRNTYNKSIDSIKKTNSLNQIRIKTINTLINRKILIQ